MITLTGECIADPKVILTVNRLCMCVCVCAGRNVGIAIKAQFSVVRPGKKTWSFL